MAGIQAIDSILPSSVVMPRLHVKTSASVSIVGTVGLDANTKLPIVINKQLRMVRRRN